jgi:hypothetical protein
MASPIDADWSNNTISDGNLNKTTYGQDTSFPSTWPTDRLFWRTDTEKIYHNTGTVATPVWTEITLAGERITSGTVAAARIDNLDTSKLTTGTLTVARGGTGGTLPVTNGGTGVASPTLDKILIGAGSSAMTLGNKPNVTDGTQVTVGDTPSGSSNGEADLGYGNAYTVSITFPTTAPQFRVDQIITRYKNLTASGIIASSLTNRAIAVTASQTGTASYANYTFDFGEEAVFQGGQTIRWGVMCMSPNVSGHRFSTGTTAGSNSGTTISEYGSSFSNSISTWSGSQSMPFQLKYTPMGDF